ncbi:MULTISPECIES: hypothetical protein [Priestia]|uniref:Uncharacterized protein n=2 Tax=Priestia TaxID=2800373 RepID=A0AAX6NEP2_PRIAR|nr:MULTISPECIES: hypothetical protein [Priestia]AEN91052.1 hypothetical protein BMWSH_4173 [Priestia megaterium WSH-002]MDU9694289.1 hypothetical protein [Priestia aryabhattai]
MINELVGSLVTPLWISVQDSCGKSGTDETPQESSSCPPIHR